MFGAKTSRWPYLYRAVDKQGKTVDFLLRRDRGIAAAQAFFRKALATNPTRWPRKVTLDGHTPSHRALRLLGRENPKWKYVEVRSCKYLNNIVEQDHRAIKRRCASMKGFKSFTTLRSRLPESSWHIVFTSVSSHSDSAGRVVGTMAASTRLGCLLPGERNSIALRVRRCTGTSDRHLTRTRRGDCRSRANPLVEFPASPDPATFANNPVGPKHHRLERAAAKWVHRRSFRCLLCAASGAREDLGRRGPRGGDVAYE
jgi:hypothetical protein